MLAVRPKELASMLTRHGIRLDADVYRPDGAGEFPVLLMRQPYGRAIASTVVYAHPTWYAAHGYIVVIQDVRGRGSSEGEFDLFAHEIDDGWDTVTWAAHLPGSSGQVGMYGFSYQGMTQLYAAAAKPPALKTICPSMVGYDLYADWSYEGGAFCYQLNLGWAIQLAAETARRQGKVDAYQTLYAASRNLPLADPVCAQADLLKQLAPDSFYHAWLGHSSPDEYWDTLSPRRYLQDIDLPMLHVGGWFDTYLRGTVRLYQEMASRSAYPQHLWIGPWAHLPWGRQAGAIDYGPDAASPIDRLQIRWFDHWLKGMDTGLLEAASVNLFEMGRNQWQSFAQLPQPQPTAYYLTTTGLATMGDREGALVESLSPSLDTVIDTVVHDPWRPAPALGGHATSLAGPFDRSAIDCRTDVLTYTTARLSKDMHLAGHSMVDVYCTADAPGFDLCAVLSEVKSNGAVYSISQGYVRVQFNLLTNLPPERLSVGDRQAPSPLVTPPTLVQIPLQLTCICIASGSAIRLSLSAACFPAYAVNAGDGSPSGHGKLIDARVITIGVSCGGDPPSRLLLPALT